MSDAYRDAVLADTPVLYWRMRRTGASANGDEVEDTSGEDNHGSLFDDTGIAYGWQSGIETDSTDISLRAQRLNLGTSYALLDPGMSFETGAWSLECWMYSLGAVGSSAGERVFGRQGQLQIRRHHEASPGAGAANFRLSLRATRPSAATDDAVAGMDFFHNTWYHVVAVRSGTSLVTYVNGVSVGTGTTVAGSLAASAQALVAGNDGAVISDFLVDECAVYDYALGADRVLAHYEAAKLSLPVYWTSITRASLDIDADAVLPVDFPFSHNWGQAIGGGPVPVTETLAWRTNEIQSEPDYRQRVNAQPHHAERTLDYSVTAASAVQRALLRSALHVPGEAYRIPIETDWQPLDSEAASGSNTLELDTTLRDFEVGSYAVAVPDPYDPASYQFFTITARTDTELSVSEDVGDTLPEGTPVYACRLASLPDESLAVTSHRADRETWQLRFQVLSTELSTRRVTAYTPATTYKSVEVFDRSVVKVEWLNPKQWSLSRRFEGTGNTAGDDYFRALDTGSAGLIPCEVTLTTRAQLSAFYGWLEARQGKQNPVWVVSEEHDFTKVARVSGTVIKVTRADYERTFNYGRRDLALQKADGTYFFREVSGVSDNGDGTESLTIDAPLTLAEYNSVARISFLYYSRLAADEVTLTHTRDLSTPGGMITECPFAFRQLLFSPE